MTLGLVKGRSLDTLDQILDDQNLTPRCATTFGTQSQALRATPTANTRNTAPSSSHNA